MCVKYMHSASKHFLTQQNMSFVIVMIRGGRAELSLSYFGERAWQILRNFFQGRIRVKSQEIKHKYPSEE